MRYALRARDRDGEGLVLVTMKHQIDTVPNQPPREPLSVKNHAVVAARDGTLRLCYGQNVMMQDDNPERAHGRVWLPIPSELLCRIFQLRDAQETLALEHGARTLRVRAEVRVLLQERTVQGDDVDGQRPPDEEPAPGAQKLVRSDAKHPLVELSERRLGLRGSVSYRHVLFRGPI